jgi:hypothetical protein
VGVQRRHLTLPKREGKILSSHVSLKDLKRQVNVGARSNDSEAILPGVSSAVFWLWDIKTVFSTSFCANWSGLIPVSLSGCK